MFCKTCGVIFNTEGFNGQHCSQRCWFNRSSKGDLHVRTGHEWEGKPVLLVTPLTDKGQEWWTENGYADVMFGRGSMVYCNSDTSWLINKAIEKDIIVLVESRTFDPST